MEKTLKDKFKPSKDFPEWRGGCINSLMYCPYEGCCLELSLIDRQEEEVNILDYPCELIVYIRYALYNGGIVGYITKFPEMNSAAWKIIETSVWVLNKYRYEISRESLNGCSLLDEYFTDSNHVVDYHSVTEKLEPLGFSVI